MNFTSILFRAVEEIGYRASHRGALRENPDYNFGALTEPTQANKFISIREPTAILDAAAWGESVGH